MVVGEDRRPQTRGRREVAISRAQVGSGRGRCVLDVLRVPGAVAVGVASPALPGRGDELHGADGAVPGGVTVVTTAVGVTDGGEPTAVQDRSEHRGHRAVAAVEAPAGERSRLDLADGGEQLHGEPAGARCRGDGRPVGAPQDLRDARRADRTPRSGVWHEGLESSCEGGDPERGRDPLVQGQEDVGGAGAHDQVPGGDVPVRGDRVDRGVAQTVRRVEGRRGRQGGPRRDGRRVLGSSADEEGCAERHHRDRAHQWARHRDADHAWSALRFGLGHQYSPLRRPSCCWHRVLAVSPRGDRKPQGQPRGTPRAMTI